MIRTTVFAALFALLPAAAVQAAPAQQLRVSLSDINLSTASGQSMAMDRIRGAAEAVCGPAQYSLDTRGSERAAARDAHTLCVNRAVAAAVTHFEAAGYALNGTPATRIAGN